MARNIDIHPNGVIGSCRNNPRLCRMELRIENSKIILNLVSTKNLQRHDQRIVYKITTLHSKQPPLLINGSMEDVNGAIIRASAHERVLLVELNLSYSLLVISKCFEGRGSEVEIEPGESSIEASYNEIISARMNLCNDFDSFTDTAMEETHFTPVRSLLTRVCFTRL